MDREVKLGIHAITSTKNPLYGKICGLCHKRCIKGDIVLGSVNYWVTVAMHTRCLKATLDEAPLDNFEDLREKILAGGVFGD